MFLTTTAAAAALGCSTRTLQRWRQQGLLRQGEHFWPGPFPNSTLRWDEAKLRQFFTLPQENCASN